MDSYDGRVLFVKGQELVVIGSVLFTRRSDNKRLNVLNEGFLLFFARLVQLPVSLVDVVLYHCKLLDRPLSDIYERLNLGPCFTIEPLNCIS